MKSREANTVYRLACFNEICPSLKKPQIHRITITGIL